MSTLGRGQKQYTKEFKDTMVELYNSGKSIVDLSSEYGISKSTIQGLINKVKPLVSYDEKTITAEVSVNKIKVIKRIIYGRCLRRKILLLQKFRDLN